MVSESQRPTGGGGLSPLNATVDALNLVKSISSITPAKAVFGSASDLLVTIRDSMANKQDYVELGLSCADVCQALNRGLDGRQLADLNRPVLGAIEQLTTTVAGIQKNITKHGTRNVVSRLFHAKGDKDAIVAWRRDLARVLQIFDTELAINTHVMVADIHRNALTSQAPARILLGEVPPPMPRACFGRGELIKEVAGIAETLEPIALIGAGGIGKTSVALAVLHHSRTIKRFGSNRRFIRCDQFPPSRPHLLARLSNVIGAGVENPEDMAPLRPFLSSKEMLIVLDNAETILDPQGPNCDEIYAVVDELCQFKTVCLCITSRITTVPPYCKRLQIPTLSMEAACDIFYGIYGDGGRSGIIDDLLRRLDFHALSITLLATTASNNMWDCDRLAKEWDEQRAQVLRTDHNESLAATIKLSLASPTFRKLGSKAYDLLGVVAFFPQGIDEKNLEWFFPKILDRKNIFDKFCGLSLTYRSNGFITMLAPIRDFLSPRSPTSSPLLCATKDHYFTRLSVALNPNKPGFGEARWIVSEDINIEHLLDVFASADVDALDVWRACNHFMDHLKWQKPRQTILKSRIEGLPDGHPSKAKCLFKLSWLFGSVGNLEEQKRLLTHTLTLNREWGDNLRVALTLRSLSYANRKLGHPREGIQQVVEALEMFKRLKNKPGQANCLGDLALLFLDDDQLDAAENAVLRKINLLPKKGEEFQLCQSHYLLGKVYRAKGDKEKTIDRFKTALTIASPFNWQGQLFWVHYSLAKLFRNEDDLDEANVHIEQAKSHTADGTYNLGRGMQMQARIWYRQSKLEDARSEALSALNIYERLGAVKNVWECRWLLQQIERVMEGRISGESDSICSTASSTSMEDSQGGGQGTGRIPHS